MQILQKGWSKNLNEVFKSVNNELIISSPYISDLGAEFLLKNVSNEFKELGSLKFITDLSPKNIYQGSTNPKSFKLLFESISKIQVFHLPKLHAKVYISDESKAIITSGNLTAGGIYNNYEYGVMIDENESITSIKNDLVEYGNLGASITVDEIDIYCSISDEIKELFKQRENSFKKEIERKFDKAVIKANDELIAIKLKKGASHTLFEKTILYLLNKNVPLNTVEINLLVKDIHPDLCDDTIDRVINNIRFGKKWKHTIRTAQQNLKRKGKITLLNGVWILTES